MNNGERVAKKSSCGICGDWVREEFDFGNQPVSNAFVRPSEIKGEKFFRLAIGMCTSCKMVQLMEGVPRDQMFHASYPYRSCGSSIMRKHFEQTARYLMEVELTDPSDLIVEIGSNDGILLSSVAEAGVRHLGVDASRGAVEVARKKGVRAQVDFFEESTATTIHVAEGPAKVIFSANTFSHIAYIRSVLLGVDRLLADDGVFVFEDRYLGDIVENNYLDQVYDEHFYLFSLHSVRRMAEQYGFELVDAERLPVHGGAMRYVLARPGRRRSTGGLVHLLEQETELGLAEPDTFARFRRNIERIRTDLVTLLHDLRDEGHRVVGYGATSKSATITNYCDIGPDLISFVSDSTPEKQGRLTPGSHIPVLSPDSFADPYPDYAVLFAWNHAEEIMTKERRFHDNGGRWIFYVPDVHVV